MYWLLKLIQSLVKALNSEGTPGQVAAGIALGSALGLTPLVNLHNVLILVAVLLLNVSVPGALLGWFVFVPVGFTLDPLFDGLGRALLLDVPALQGLWAAVYTTPVLALTNLTNSVVLGSLVGWMLLAAPIFFLARSGVGWYRRTVYARYRDARFFKAVRASKLYELYRWFRPTS
jgi:uncharacterized protein (TIGR03546 family)